MSDKFLCHQQPRPIFSIPLVISVDCHSNIFIQYLQTQINLFVSSASEKSRQSVLMAVIKAVTMPAVCRDMKTTINDGRRKEMTEYDGKRQKRQNRGKNGQHGHCLDHLIRSDSCSGVTIGPADPPLQGVPFSGYLKTPT